LQGGNVIKELIISSTDNPKVKDALDLREKRKRDASHLFLIEGYREILRALHGKVSIEKLFICPELFLGENEASLIEKARASSAQIISCTEKVFHKLSYRDRPDGLLAIAKSMQFNLADLAQKLPPKEPPLLVIAEAIEKPGNLGTILRSADASGAHAVLVADRCTDIYNPNVVRASVGTLFTLPVIETSSEDTLRWLKEHNVQIIAASPHATKNYTDIDFKKPSAIIVGAEQIGLSDLWEKNCTDFVKIPMKGVADSLNVAMATTILLYEAQRQRSHA
jgi:RNA methyltransferase, TrmH family